MSAQIDEFRSAVHGREVTNETTLDKYCKWIRRFEHWRPGDEPDESVIRDFDSFLDDEAMADYPWENARGPHPPDSYSFQSRVEAISALKHWFKYQYEPIETEVQNLALGEPEPFDPTVIPESEVKNIFVNARHQCDIEGCEAAMKVGYDSIMRGAEITKIRREDVNRENQSLYVRAVKNSNRITLGLSDSAWIALRKHMNNHPDRDVLFRNSYGNPWSPSAWSNHFRTKHHPAGWHAVGRHSAITNRLRKGEDFGSVFQRARHKSVAMTIRYASIVDADIPGWAGQTTES